MLSEETCEPQPATQVFINTDLEVETQVAGDAENIRVGASLHVNAYVHLGDLTPEDVSVQAYYGPLDINHQVTRGELLALVWKQREGDLHRYEGEVPCETSGMQGFTVRVLPSHLDAKVPEELPIIAWE